ncbi:MAG: NUDIX hydrolase [Gemmatimonadetes bacterium]|nr:NUDIX hydrolase [Gemmatimonadota bacterium]
MSGSLIHWFNEFAEEVGVELDPTELVFLGQLHLEDPSERYWRHAMQFFYLCTRPIALDETVFNEEVSAFVEVTLADFDALVSGRSASIQGQARYEETPNEIRPQEITPAAFAAYSEQIMHAIRCSARAIDTYLKNDQVDAAIWSPPTG